MNLDGYDIGALCLTMPHFRSWPAGDAVSPRTGDDLLFFHLLLRDSYPDSSIVQILATRQDSRFYLEKDGVLRRPVDGASVVDIDLSAARPRTRHSIRKRAIDSYAWARRSVIGAMAASGFVEDPLLHLGFPSEAVPEPRPRRREQLIDFGPWADSLAPNHSADELAAWLAGFDLPDTEIPPAWRERIGKEAGSSWSADRGMVDGPRLICPSCGVVEPVPVDIRSPDWTWRARVGRAWAYLCCPSCLGCFGRVGYVMN